MNNGAGMVRIMAQVWYNINGVIQSHARRNRTLQPLQNMFMRKCAKSRATSSFCHLQQGEERQALWFIKKKRRGGRDGTEVTRRRGGGCSGGGSGMDAIERWSEKQSTGDDVNGKVVAERKRKGEARSVWERLGRGHTLWPKALQHQASSPYCPGNISDNSQFFLEKLNKTGLKRTPQQTMQTEAGESRNRAAGARKIHTKTLERCPWR
jgi:hypothetical protein